MLQCVAVCCSVLRCVAVCCSVLQCVAVCCSVLHCGTVWCSVVQRVAEFAECCRVFAECCIVRQCVAVRGMGTKRFKQTSAVTYIAHPLRLRVSMKFCLCLSVFMSVCEGIQTHRSNCMGGCVSVTRLMCVSVRM